jgi:hypothetical protein
LCGRQCLTQEVAEIVYIVYISCQTWHTISYRLEIDT